MQPVCDGDFVYRDIVWNAYTSQALLKKSEEFQFRSDDIVVCTFPRSGTTFTQEIIWQIVNCDKVTRDAHFDNIDVRFPFLEFNYEDFYEKDCPSAFEALETASAPRLIKTHIPYRMLRTSLERVRPKIVIVMRNPKDVAISCFNFYKTVKNFKWTGGPFSEFIGYFLQGRVFTGDFFENNKEWWSLRHQENILILRYEDLVKQPIQEIRKTAAFLGKPLTFEQLDIIAHNTSFKVMSQNTKTNIVIGNEGQTFLRKGKAGDWKNVFTVAENEAMDEAIRLRLQDSDLSFHYD